MWFCEKRPIDSKKVLLGRNWHLQEEVENNTRDLDADLAAVKKRLDRKFGRTAGEISVLDT